MLNDAIRITTCNDRVTVYHYDGNSSSVSFRCASARSVRDDSILIWRVSHSGACVIRQMFLPAR